MQYCIARWMPFTLYLLLLNLELKEKMGFNGQCLCKAVKYEVKPPLISAAHCHCESCRRANSAAFVSWGTVAENQISIKSGAESLKKFESSKGAYRIFCTNCGSHLLMKYDAEPDFTYFTLASLVACPDVIPDRHYSFEEHVNWFSLNDELPRFQGKTCIRIR